ncbi:unnamed protein product [Prorocentrum cordatum]|uniref:Phosphoribosylformylglycinamidine synthase n=1 Tax=Prorocentrum cordatum TaxID=2364126 RepID=A0ABN9S0A3_9DINO|nr:unnamed protein product [Polarella glacialis]
MAEVTGASATGSNLLSRIQGLFEIRNEGVTAKTAAFIRTQSEEMQQLRPDVGVTMNYMEPKINESVLVAAGHDMSATNHGASGHRGMINLYGDADNWEIGAVIYIRGNEMAGWSFDPNLVNCRVWQLSGEAVLQAIATATAEANDPTLDRVYSGIFRTLMADLTMSASVTGGLPNAQRSDHVPAMTIYDVFVAGATPWGEILNCTQKATDLSDKSWMMNFEGVIVNLESLIRDRSCPRLKSLLFRWMGRGPHGETTQSTPPAHGAPTEAPTGRTPAEQKVRQTPPAQGGALPTVPAGAPRASPVIQLYSTQGLEAGQVQRLLKSVQDVGVPAAAFATEFCFNVASGAPLSGDDMAKVKWCLAEGGHAISAETRLRPTGHDFVVEVGPRMNFTTAWSTNCVSVLRAAEVESVSRLERSRRFLVSSTSPLSTQEKATLISVIHDRMTEMVYPTPIVSFESGMVPKPVQSVPVLKDGRAALEEINRELGLGFDDWDYEYYLNLFVNDLKRDPTDCELFDLAQSNSEHSRHWFFGGKMVIDGQEKEESLFKIVKDTLNKNPNANNNSVIAFHDNSSSIVGARVPMLLPSYYLEKEGEPGKPCAYTQADVDMDLLLTCETHNMPTGICPFNGAETGTGGRLRDVQATGIGGSYVAGTIGYCVGALNLPHDKKPYEDPSWNYPSSMASPARILIEGSNGCSDYGNKFGEPLILGFCRSFGLRTAGGERREWIKPILFTGGFGQMDSKHRKKLDPDVGMKVVKIGGPAYRIGMGGGSASSRADGDSRSDLDFNAVQRGDAEMEQKMNRVIRACCELGERNPFVQLHDQGCGGNCNVLKEVLDPIGGQIDIREIVLGDPTMSVLEIWGAEYQESNCCLVREESLPLLKQIAQRERSCVTAVGTITGDGTCTVLDRVDGSVPVQLPLRQVLGKLPPKTFRSNRADLAPAADPPGIARALFGRQDATALPVTLDLVLSNVTVGSKRFLTNKVDRSVTGLVARQQCVGPLLTPLADCAVIAHSMLTPDGVPVRGGVTAIGEQPIKGLLSGAANARMSVGEALTNIVWAKCTALGDISGCSGNWMWASKLPGEGALMYDTALALREVMHTLGVCIDGGKDSLSMFARTDTKELVKAPGELTISLYCSCPDVTMTVTPDLKRPAPERHCCCWCRSRGPPRRARAARWPLLASAASGTRQRTASRR